MSTNPPTDPLAKPAGPPPPPPPSPSPRRLTRSSTDRVLGGVAGGIAEYFAIDAVIVRIAFVVLVFVGGAGVLAYLAALLLVPNAASAAADGTAVAPRDRNPALVTLGVIALLIVALPLAFGSMMVAGSLLFPLAFLVLAGLAAAWLATGRWPEREAGPIVRSTLLGLGVLVLLCVVAFGAAWGAGAGGEGVVAGLVIAAGLALVAGAFVRPVRWLIPVALALAIPASFVQAAGIDLEGGYGDRHYRPGTVEDIREHYEIAAGEMTIDLRGVDFAARDYELEVEVGMGEANVIVPEDVCVATDADVGMGAVRVFSESSEGIDVDLDDQRTAKPGNARLIVNGDVGLGELRIRDTNPELFDWHDDRPDFFGGDDGAEERNTACASG